MAKASMIAREEKRSRTVAKYAEKRAALRAVLRDANVSDDEKWAAQVKLQKLPRNSAPTRMRNRCWKTGRPRGFFRFFGLCRNAVREMSHDCALPGVTKASW